MFVSTLENAGAMLTGKTVLFETQQAMNRGGSRPSGDFTPPANMSPPEGFSPPSGMNMAGNIPFAMLFQNIAKSINTVLLLLTAVSGLLAVRMLKKLD